MIGTNFFKKMELLVIWRKINNRYKNKINY